jgi:hypothetical protein
MKKFALLTAPLLLMMLVVSPAEAAPSLQERLKTSYNDMVQDVREENDPAAKREILTVFLTRLDRGLGLVEKMAPASAAQASVMRETVQGHLDELKGMDARAPGAAGNFNAYAGYLQQTVEQADGIYLSVGALIIILLILILVL